MMKYRVLLIICLLFAMSGCAGHHTALTKGQTNVDVTGKSIALISAKITNQHKPNYQLDIVTTYICPPSKTDCSSSAGYAHKTNKYCRIKSVAGNFNEYLLSFELASGTYNLDSMGAIYTSVLITGGGIVPLKFKLDIRPNSIIYLGHLDIVMRKRANESETRAGRVYPLIDQATIGASSGTFDVVVEDKFEEDMKMFISEYPALQKVRIEKSLLPQWTRPKNEPTN